MFESALFRNTNLIKRGHIFFLGSQVQPKTPPKDLYQIIYKVWHHQRSWYKRKKICWTFCIGILWHSAAAAPVALDELDLMCSSVEAHVVMTGDHHLLVSRVAQEDLKACGDQHAGFPLLPGHSASLTSCLNNIISMTLEPESLTLNSFTSYFQDWKH